MFLMRGREMVSRWAHNPKIGGSIPSSANYYVINEFVIIFRSSLAGRASDSESEGPRFES